MKIAIIGGSGFIGSHTASKLHREGYTDITIIDKVPPFRNVLTSIKPRYIKCDITKRSNISDIILAEQFDIIYFLAGIIRAEEVRVDPVYSYKVNIMGLVNTLDAVVKTKHTKFIYSSTTHVYTDNTDESCVDEETVLDNKIHLYPGSKLCAETIIKGYHMLFGLQYLIFRYSVAYGAEGHNDNVVHTFVRNAITGAVIRVFGKGNVWRDLLYVTDHANGNYLGMIHRDIKNTTIILGGFSIPIPKLAELVASTVNPSIKIELADYMRPGDHAGDKIISRERAKTLLGWEPQVEIPAGVKLLFDYYMLSSNR